MKAWIRSVNPPAHGGYLVAAAILVVQPASQAATRYVNLNHLAPAPPYTSWATAATNIQDAVDAAVPGDEVVVTNGVYASGGRRFYPGHFLVGQSNRVAV